MKRYRLVVDYGYGDKTWLQRDLTEEQVIEAFKQSARWNRTPTLEEILDCEGLYYVEIDNPDDTEDWDWQNS